MTKISLGILSVSLLCNAVLYHFYDSTSSKLHIATQDVVRLEDMQSSLQKQLEYAHSVRKIEDKTSVEWKVEQVSLEDKKDVLIAKITTQSKARSCDTQGVKINAQESDYASLDDRLDPDIVSVLSEAASDLQRSH